MMRIFVILLILVCAPALAAAPRASKQTTNRQSKHKLTSPQKTEPAVVPTKLDSSNNLRLAIGGGLQNIYLPSLSVEILGVWGALQMGGELGFFQVSQSQFNGSTSFMGLSGRWRMSPSQPFFLGVSFGNRSVSLTTNADLSYTDSSSGATSITTIAWTRKVSQMILYPKAGLMWTDNKSALVAGLGLLIPISSKASISGNPPSANGISDDDYQGTAEQKLRDVTKTTDAILPGLELKYLRFLN